MSLIESTMFPCKKLLKEIPISSKFEKKLVIEVWANSGVALS